MRLRVFGLLAALLGMAATATAQTPPALLNVYPVEVAESLASGATLLLYDGSPFHPDGNVLWDYAEAERCTHFGTSAKYIDALKKAGVAPVGTHDLASLRTLLSTGSPLAPESFDYVYEAIKKDLHLASISGGTDICGCFVLGIPTKPAFVIAASSRRASAPVSPCRACSRCAASLKSSNAVGSTTALPSASTRPTSTAAPRLWREPTFGSATYRGSGTLSQSTCWIGGSS